MTMDMGRTARGGPAHKIMAYGAPFWSVCTARQSEDILAMKEDLFGYDRYRIPCKYLPYKRIDLGLNWLVALPPRLYKAGRDPLKFISYSIQSNKDTGRRVLRRLDGPNLSKSLSLRLVSPSGSYHAHLHRSIYLRGIPFGGLPTIFCRHYDTPSFMRHLNSIELP